MYWALGLGEEPKARQAFKNARQKEQHMTTPAEFHRRLEQKGASRIDFLSGIGNRTPPRDPNDDDDEEPRRFHTENANLSPIDYLLQVSGTQRAPPGRRTEVAKFVAPYLEYRVRVSR